MGVGLLKWKEELLEIFPLEKFCQSRGRCQQVLESNSVVVDVILKISFSLVVRAVLKVIILLK